MFRCYTCKQVTKPYEPQHKRVIETRRVIYPSGSHGDEIVREIAECETCSKKVN